MASSLANLREWIAQSPHLRNIRQDDQVGNRCHVFLTVILCVCMCVINLREWIAQSPQLRNIRQDDLLKHHYSTFVVECVQFKLCMHEKMTINQVHVNCILGCVYKYILGSTIPVA